MPAPDLARLQTLLADNEMAEILGILLDEHVTVSDDIRREAGSLSGRLDQLREKNRAGTLSAEQATLEENRIREALAQLIAALRPPTREQLKKLRAEQRKWVLPALLYALVAAGLVWWLFRPLPAFRIEANLLVERLSFRYLEGPTDFAQGNVQWCAWQNYQQAELGGERLLLDRELDGRWEQNLPLASTLHLEANPDISGIGLQFGPAHLEKLLLAPQALLTLSHPEEDESLLRLTVQQNAVLQGDWTYRDSLLVQAEQFTVQGIPDDTAFSFPVQMCVLPPQGMAREIALRSFPGSTTIDLKLGDTLLVESDHLVISDPSFYQPVENVAVPTVLSGQIHIAEVDKPVLRTIDISEGEALDIVSTDKLALSKLLIRPEGIALQFSGTIARLETGKYHDLRNPLRLEWLWRNHRVLLLAIGIAFLGLSLFLPPKIRDRIFEILKIAKGF